MLAAAPRGDPAATTAALHLLTSLLADATAAEHTALNHHAVRRKSIVASSAALARPLPPPATSPLFRLYPLSDPRSADDACPPGDPRLLLSVAAAAHATAVAERLVAAGAPVDAAAADTGTTALHAAVASKALGVLHVLLDAGADYDAVAADGSTPLHTAVALGDFDAVSDKKRIVDALVRAGADASIPNAAGHTPLHLAAVSGYPALVAFLARALPGSAAALAPSGRAPLHDVLLAPTLDSRAAMDTVAELLRSGAKVNALCTAPYAGYTPLQLAVAVFPESEYQHAIIGALLQAGASRASLLPASAPPPLCLAVALARVETVSYLLSLSFDAKQPAADGMTPLHYAAAAPSLPLVRALLAAGADPNASTSATPPSFRIALASLPTQTWAQVAGVTPLHLAAALEAEDIVAALSDAGGNLALRAGSGNTAADLVLSSTHLQGLILAILHLQPPWSSRIIPFDRFRTELPVVPPRHALATLSASAKLYTLVSNAPLDLATAKSSTIPAALALLASGASLHATPPHAPPLLFALVAALPPRGSRTHAHLVAVTGTFFALLWRTPLDAHPVWPVHDEQLALLADHRLDTAYLAAAAQWPATLPPAAAAALDFAAVNPASPDRDTLLHAVARADLGLLVTLCSTLGGAVDVANARGAAPLDVAVASSSSFATAALLAAGAPLHCSDAHLVRTLSAVGGSSHLVATLAASSHPTLTPAILELAALNAILARDAPALAALLAAGCSPDTVVPPTHGLATRAGTSLLLLTAYLASEPLLSLLLAAGASPSVADAAGLTPLHALVVQNSNAADACLATLLAHSSDLALNAPDTHGLTPLLYLLDIQLWAVDGARSLRVATICKRVAALLAAGADPNAASSAGETPLFRALLGPGTGLLLSGSAQVAAQLLAAGAAVDAVDASGSTLLHRFCTLGATGPSIWLISHGANVTLTNASGQTALHLAAQHIPTSDVVITLVPRLLAAAPSAAFVNAADILGRSALHYAVLAGSAVTIHQLTESGAVAVRDADGLTPQDLVLKAAAGNAGDGGDGDDNPGASPHLAAARQRADADGGASAVAAWRRSFDQFKGMVTLVVATLQLAGFALALDLEWHSATATANDVVAASVFFSVVSAVRFGLLFWLATALVACYLAAFTLRAFRLRRVGAVITWLFSDIFFVPLLTVFVSTFRCSSGALAASPDQACWTPSHTYMAAAAGCILVVYVPLSFRLVRLDHQPEAVTSVFTLRWSRDVLLLKKYRLHRMTKRVTTRVSDLLLHATKLVLVSITVVFFDRVMVLLGTYVLSSLVYITVVVLYPSYVRHKINATHFALSALVVGVDVAAAAAYVVDDDTSLVPPVLLALAATVLPTTSFFVYGRVFASAGDRERIDLNQALQSVIHTREALSMLHVDDPASPAVSSLHRHDNAVAAHHYSGAAAVASYPVAPTTTPPPPSLAPHTHIAP